MTPDELFTLHSPAAREIVTKLIWHYRSSGALQYQDEAHSEGQLALWQLCNRFDPGKQAFQVKKERQRQTDLLYSIMFGYDLTPVAPIDPYQNFWMLVVLRVKGAVIDFFRAQKLILKRSLPPDLKQMSKEQLRDIKNRLGRKEDEQQIAANYGIQAKSLDELKPTMFYRERFVSLDRNLSDFGGVAGSNGGDSFADVLPAPDCSGDAEQQAHIAYLITLAMQDAELNQQETRVIDLYFYDNRSKADVAREVGMSQVAMTRLLDGALAKIREYWPELQAERISA